MTKLGKYLISNLYLNCVESVHL